jgi:putative DNA primase/helicase
MSHSSAEVTYRPAGPGHRARTARVDLSRIPDPEAWLTNRLGRLAHFEMQVGGGAQSDAGDLLAADRLELLASRLTASMDAALAARREALDGLVARLEAARPSLRRSAPPTMKPEEETFP